MKLSRFLGFGLALFTTVFLFQNCGSQPGGESGFADSASSGLRGVLNALSDGTGISGAGSSNARFPAPQLSAEGHAMTWDGRVLIKMEGLKPWTYQPLPDSLAGKPAWHAMAIRPQNVTLVNGKPSFETLFSNSATPKVWGVPDSTYKALGSPANLESIPLHGVNALAIVPDRSFRENPYRSDVNGNASSGGSYRTYQTLFYTQDYEQCDTPDFGCTPQAQGTVHIGYMKIQIVVKNPNTASADIESVKRKSDFFRFYSKAGVPVRGIEPTVTFDGRLMIYQMQSRLKFVFNENPPNPNQWTDPQPLDKLYAMRDQLVKTADGTGTAKFGELYRVAQYPMRFPSGEPITDTIGAYPWIDLDGEDFFESTTLKNGGGTSAGYAILGASTKGMLRHIDGGINPDRRAFRRVIISSFGKAPGSWFPFDLQTLPVSRKRSVFPIFGTHFYSEVALEEGVAGDYDVYLPMNESLYRGSATEAFDYDLTSTQDVSGNFHNARLIGGAKFSDDYLNCTESCDEKENRFSGKAIYFEPNGRVEVPHQSATGHALLGGKSMTVSFAIRLMRDPSGNAFNIVSKDGSFNVLVESTRQLQFSVQTAAGFRRSGFVGTPLPLNEWAHVAFTYDHTTGNFEYYLNGGRAAVASLGSASPVSKNTSPLILGPNSGAGGGTVYALDQVALSPKVRTSDEIYRQNDLIIASAASAGPALPSGLKIRDQRLLRDRKLNSDRVELGRNLFADPNLSSNGSISCATCHQPDKAWTDGRALAAGFGGKILKRNTPSLFNMAFHDDFMHDGSRDTLEQQLAGVVQNPDEMNGNFAAIATYLNSDPRYTTLKAKAFGSTVLGQNEIVAALAEFTLSLMNGDSKHDKVRAGTTTFSAQELMGFQLFNGRARCAECHAGSDFTDNQYHNVGFVNSTDEGRFLVTAAPADKFRFRTPSLRNIALTAPYMHDGSLATLEAVIAQYNAAPRLTENGDPIIQPLGLNLEEQNALVAYLKTLTGSTTNPTLPTIPKREPGGSPVVPPPAALKSCTFNGKTYASGAKVQAYQAATVPFGSSCVSQDRLCTDGVLGGTYTFATCAPQTAAPSLRSCSFNDKTYASGAKVKAYQAASVPYGASCVSQDRLCTDGTLSGSYAYASCVPQTAPPTLRSCTFNGKTFASGAKVQAFQAASVPYGASCVSQDRLCTDGVLSGTYAYATCASQTAPPQQPPADVRATKIKDFVKRLFQVVMGSSNPTPAAMDPYLTPLLRDSSVANCQAVVKSFYASDAFVKKKFADGPFVNLVYRGIFKREADTSGRSFWSSQLSSKALTRDQVVDAFLRADEAKPLCQF